MWHLRHFPYLLFVQLAHTILKLLHFVFKLEMKLIITIIKKNDSQNNKIILLTINHTDCSYMVCTVHVHSQVNRTKHHTQGYQCFGEADSSRKLSQS